MSKLDVAIAQEYNRQNPTIIPAVEGMKIRARRDVRGVSSSYNTPERIDINEGAVLLVPASGTRFGDCFCRLLEGVAIVNCRGIYEGKKREVQINNNMDVIGLVEGYEAAPYSLGRIDTEVWEVL
jgi:hypothetical protein